MVINVSEIKTNIIKFLEEKGPSLPVHIMKITNMNLTISSAILSEMLSEKTIKQSHLKIGSSSLYLLPEQESQLERFSDNLKGFEKEAFLRLKKSGFLEDDKQDPAIRVALQNIKDFAVPVKIDNNKIWKYSLSPQENIQKINIDLKENQITNSPFIPEKVAKIIENPPSIEIKPEENKEIVLTTKEKSSKKPKKEENTFFLEIKEKIISWGGNLIEVIYVSKKELILRVVLNGNELLLLAWDKKRIDEKEIFKLQKKTNIKLPFFLLTKSEVPKKMKDLIELYKNIAGTGIF